MAVMFVQYDGGYWGMPTFIVCGLLLYFVAIPLIVASQFWLAVRPEVTTLGRPRAGVPPTLPLPPPRVEAFFMIVEEELARSGFEPLAWLECRRSAARAGLHLALFNNPGAGDRAAAIYAVGRVTGDIELPHHIVQIETETADGRSWNTTNARLVPGHPEPPWRTTWRFPGMGDLGRLYEVHRALVQLEPAPPGRGALMLDPAEEFVESSIRVYQHLVRQGHLRPDRSGTRYKLRLRAVPYWVVGQLWPIPIFRRWLMRREARRQLIRLGSDPHYPRADYGRLITRRMAGAAAPGS